MKPCKARQCAFSLVEVTLALGVAAFSLLVILAMLPVSLKTNQASANQTVSNGIISQIAADLRASARLPPGQVSKQFSLDPRKGVKGNWDPTPDCIYFDYDGRTTGTGLCTAAVPSNSIYRVLLTYRQPPVDTTSLADLKVTWPAAQSDPTKVA